MRSAKCRQDWLEGPVVSLAMAREAARVEPSWPASGSADAGPGVAEIDAEIAQAADLLRSRDLTLTDYTQAVRILRAQRAEAEARAAESVSLLPFRHTDHYAWTQASLGERRALVARHVDHVVLNARTSRGPGRFEPERITVMWRDGTEQTVTPADLDPLAYWDAFAERWEYPVVDTPEPDGAQLSA